MPPIDPVTKEEEAVVVVVAAKMADDDDEPPRCRDAAEGPKLRWAGRRQTAVWVVSAVVDYYDDHRSKMRLLRQYPTAAAAVP